MKILLCSLIVQYCMAPVSVTSKLDIPISLEIRDKNSRLWVHVLNIQKNRCYKVTSKHWENNAELPVALIVYTINNRQLNYISLDSLNWKITLEKPTATLFQPYS